MRSVARHIPGVPRCYRAIGALYAYMEFVARYPKQWRKRIEIVRRFRTIGKNVTCSHSGKELLFIAHEALKLSSHVEGDMVERGIYKGGTTCKPGIAAKIIGRKLIACDSFSGLPEPKDFDTTHINYNGTQETYREGDYCGALEEVRTNLEQFGEPNVTELVQGYFQDTLPSLRTRKAALVFIDVGLYESLVCCIENLWPILQPGCKLFTHEAHHLLTVRAFSDKHLWQSKFGSEPPYFHGGGQVWVGI